MDVLKEHRKIKVSLLKNNNGQFIDIGIPKNPRVINKDNFELLLDSLKESDLTQIRPLDVLQHGDDYVVLSGNQRLRALKKLKIKEVPCNVLKDDLDPKIYRQIVMQANTNYGEWNHEDLANEWSEDELEMWGYDVPEIDEEELAPVETLGDDDVPESAPAITVKGDLYLLGEHRLLCGDSTMIDDVEKLMDGARADMVFTDPPYGTASKSKITKNGKNLESFDIDWDKSIPIEFISILPSIVKVESTAIIFTNNLKVEFIWNKLKECNIKPLQTIYWVKTNPVPHPRKNYCSGIETGVFARGTGDILWNGGGSSKNYIEAPICSGNERTKHPTQKPLTVCDYYIKNSTNKNSLVLDLFLGSGSTLIACEKTNRKCYGMELDEKYCDVIVKRYIEFCVKNNKEAKVYRNSELISNDVFLVG